MITVAVWGFTAGTTKGFAILEKVILLGNRYDESACSNLPLYHLLTAA